MTKINIFRDEWCEMLFEERNHEYGAFVLRKESGRRHLLAIFITVLGFAIGITAPGLIKRVLPEAKVDKTVVTELTKLDVQKDKKLDETKRIEVVTEIKELRATIKFVPPVILPDEQVDDTDTIRTMDELTDNKAQISFADQEGRTDVVDAVGPDVQQILEDTSTTVYTYVEQMPEFPGGMDEFNTYLKKNIKYPEIAQENGISGRVFVQFVVSSNGLISNVTIARGVDPSLDREAMRVIKNMPPWKPGKQNGNPVKVQMSLPVNFKLE